MAYLERLREARYERPGGVVTTFEFRALDRSRDKKAAIHEPPEQNEAPVQDLGNAAERYPIEARITGPDYDLVADAFFDSLGEQGAGLLRHPRWGDIPVLPLRVSQSEAFVEGMRMAAFQIDFVRVPPIEFIVSQAQLAGQIESDLAAFEESGSEDIGIGIDPETVAESERVKGTVTDTLADFKANIEDVISDNEDLAAQFDAAVRDFENNLDTLILTPIVMAQSFISLARLPGRVVTSIKAKVDGYRASIATLGTLALTTANGAAEAASKFMQFFAFLLGISESSLAGTINDREEAATLADDVRDALADVLGFLEADESETGYVAPQSSVTDLRALIASTSELLLGQSFSLPIERRLTLTEDRTPIDLVFELYSALDQLDDFIETNALQDDEIYLIPRGREVVYYV